MNAFSRMKSPPLCLITSLAVLGLLQGSFFCAPASAHRHDFPFTYDWKQPAHGEKEVEAHTTYRKSDTSFEEELEFEYGATKRFSIAPYVVFGHGPSESLHYTGFQLEARYQLRKYETSKILSGLYAEYAKPKDDHAALESRIVLSLYDAHGGDFSFNYVLSNGFGANPNFQKTYSLGYAFPIGKGAYDVRNGVEWIHDLHDGHINFGPVVSLKTSDATSLTAGYAFALNHQDANKGEARVIAEYEF